MTGEIERQDLAADRAAGLLFLLFIAVADAEAGLTAREVQSLNAMLDAPDWSASAFLRRALGRLRVRYSALWQDYQKGAVTRDPSLAARQLSILQATPGAPGAAEIAAALRAFLDRLAHDASPIVVRLGIAAGSPAKRVARAAIDALLENACREAPIATAAAPGRALARIAAAAEPGAPPAAGPADLTIWPAALLAASPENLWRRGRIVVRCVAAIPETADVQTFVFVAVTPVLFDYKPGQFVTLELPIDGKTVRRSFTLSSSPSRPHTMSITVKRAPGGLVSNWLHDRVQEGFELPLSGPHGMFTCFNAPATRLLLIAAGSGITPIMSMLRWIADTASAADVVLLNNVRTPADVIFESELRYLGARMGERLKVGVIPGALSPGRAWNGPCAHFSEQLIRLWAPDFAEREVFVCGPLGYMELVRATLLRLGFPMAHHHEESFGTPAVGMVVAAPSPAAPYSAPAAPEPRPAAAAQAPVEIVFTTSGKTLIAAAGDFILDFAEDHGVEIESGCRAGNCGTCKVRKTEGEVVMEDQQALSEADIADGFVLTCVGRAFGTRLVLQA